MTLSLYNTLTRCKETFEPADEKNVRMYVCGPTVYDRAHLGNARSVVVYDVLYRLLCLLYGKPYVNYVRNITDVDDKINAAAKANGEPISALTERVTGWFHEDMGALSCLRPNVEPRATEHISEMHALIQKLMANGHAYEKKGHVLFDVASVPHYAPGTGDSESFTYGMLSHRVQEDLQAGARVEVESYKKNPGDFVLWKPAEAGDDASSVFESPWGAGRPGWHIECSAMSEKHLGGTFDIHGGGADLMFPHHENEIAQSRCADKDAKFARFWVHNGFLTVNGEKMSKSLGNFVTVRDLLEKGVKGEMIRFALMSTRYSEPLDWNDKLLHDAKTSLDKFYRSIGNGPRLGVIPQSKAIDSFIQALCEDLNFPKAFSVMHTASGEELYAMGALIGFFGTSTQIWFQGEGENDKPIQALIDERIVAKKAKNWPEADRIRKELAGQGITLEDRPDGTTDWRRT